MPSVYESVRGNKPPRSVFNLSYAKSFTCDLGQIIPIMCDEVVPGDKFQIGTELVVRFQPQVTPILHPINATIHYFFCANRLLDTHWEDFITGGETGEDASSLDRWTPTGGNVTNDDGNVVADNGVGSLWDFMCFPTGVIPTGALPLNLPRAAYNFVWNNFYRDEWLQSEIALTSSVVKNVAWLKDYFTSALESQQKGIAPALPISGTTQALWPTYDTANQFNLLGSSASDKPASANTEDVLENNTIDLSPAVSVDIADLRLAFQIQRWLELNARGGTRYTEWLMSHFGVSARDDRLQRPEFIGGCRMPVIVSEVLQTSQTDPDGTPQGTMAGHALAAGAQRAGSYFVREHGVIIGLMFLRPDAMYFQGIEKQWLRTSRYDFYSPEWANLAEQPVVRAELYANGVSNDNNTIFGWQGRFNEMRSKSNRVCSLMRPGVAGSLGDYWNMVQEYPGAPELNETFIRCVPRKEWLAVPSEPACIVHVANKIKAVRPMPVQAEPGLIDH